MLAPNPKSISLRKHNNSPVKSLQIPRKLHRNHRCCCCFCFFPFASKYFHATLHTASALTAPHRESAANNKISHSIIHDFRKPPGDRPVSDCRSPYFTESLLATVVASPALAYYSWQEAGSGRLCCTAHLEIFYLTKSQVSSTIPTSKSASQPASEPAPTGTKGKIPPSMSFSLTLSAAINQSFSATHILFAIPFA